MRSNNTHPQGYLWVYDDNSVGFLWSDALGFLIDLERLDPDSI